MLLDFTIWEVLGQDIVCWILCVEKGTIANFGLHLPQHVIEKGFFSSKAVCLTLNCLTLCCLWAPHAQLTRLRHIRHGPRAEQAPNATVALTSDVRRRRSQYSTVWGKWEKGCRCYGDMT